MLGMKKAHNGQFYDFEKALYYIRYQITKVN